MSARQFVYLPLVAALVLSADLGSVRAQTADQVNQFQEIIEEQQRQLEEAREFMREQRRIQDDQAARIDDQTAKIEALEEQVETLLERPPRGALQVPDGEEDLTLPPPIAGAPAPASNVTGGPVTPAESRQRLEDPSTITTPRGDRPGDFTVAFGAHLNRQFSAVADGNRTKTYQVDSTNVPSFVFLKAQADVDEDNRLGAHVEYGVQENSAAAVNQNNEQAGFTTSGRFFEVTLDNSQYGKGSFGKGWASTFFLFDVDKSGQAFGNFNATGQAFPGLLFYSKDTNNYTNITVGEAFLDIEQTSLINRIRYDSPVWKGLQLSGHFGENQQRGGRLLYNNADLGDFALTAAASYQNKPNGPTDWRVDGGIGILHEPTGLNFTAFAAQTEFSSDGRKSEGFAVRPGWRKRLFDIGETKTSIDFNRNWDVTDGGDTATSIGTFVVQDLDAFGMSVYAGYRYFDLDRDDVSLDDIHVFSTGVSVAFDGQLTFDRESKLVR